MDKYIDREAFLEDAEERYCVPCKGVGKDHNGLKCRACWVDDMCGDIIGAPAADVEPVVRCKDCIYSYEEFGFIYCTFGPYGDCAVPSQFYCAEGKRKEKK